MSAGVIIRCFTCSQWNQVLKSCNKIKKKLEHPGSLMVINLVFSGVPVGVGKLQRRGMGTWVHSGVLGCRDGLIWVPHERILLHFHTCVALHVGWSLPGLCLITAFIRSEGTSCPGGTGSIYCKIRMSAAHCTCMLRRLSGALPLILVSFLWRFPITSWFHFFALLHSLEWPDCN